MTLQAVSWMQQMKPTAFYGTPSYALRVAETARELGATGTTGEQDDAHQSVSGRPVMRIPACVL